MNRMVQFGRFIEECLLGRFIVKDPKRIRLALIILGLSVVILYLSTISNYIPVKASLALLSGIGIGSFLCIGYGVALNKAIVVVSSSLSIFGLAILYAQYSRGLLF